MDSIVVLIVMQIPAVAIVFFAFYLFKEVQKDRSALLAAREALENASHESSGAMPNINVENIQRDFEGLVRRLDSIESSLDSGKGEGGRDQIANQKQALKEFGRVLSKTSEQTYNEIQDLDQRISTLFRTLEANGFDVIRSDAA